MKRNLHILINGIIYPTLALLILLAVSPEARAIVIFPANVRNKTSVPVEITVLGVQTQLGKPSTTNEVKVTIQPEKNASVMIMGGSFGTGASSTQQITISQAPSGGKPVAKPIAPPLVIDKPTSTMAREFVVDIDPKTARFTFEPVALKPVEGKTANGITPQLSEGLHGYIHMRAPTPPGGFGYGVSFYTPAWPLLEKPLADFQVGLPSIWIVPENRGFDEALCPIGTLARDHWPERGPSYRERLPNH